MEFYARKVPLRSEAMEVVLQLEEAHALLRQWMAEAYASNTTTKSNVVVPFPEELLKYGKKPAAKVNSKKGGDEERVRAGSSRDAAPSRD
jgi:hypothetical protein